LFKNEKGIDYVDKNRSIVSNWDLVMLEKKEEEKVFSVRKSFDAKLRKEFLEDMKRKKNLFNLCKWEIIRKKREEEEKRMEGVVRRQQVSSFWAKLRMTSQVLKQVY